MAKLILSMDGLVLKEIALTKDRTTIGRKPNNDIIELGKYKLKFIGDAAPAAAGDKADFEKTMVLRPSAMKAAAEQAKAAGRGAQAAVAQRQAAVQQAAASATAAGIADKD